MAPEWGVLGEGARCCCWIGARYLFPHLPLLLGQKPAITPVNSAESSTSTTRPTRSTWPYMPPSVSTFCCWGRGGPVPLWGFARGVWKQRWAFSRWPGVTWGYLTLVAGIAEKALPLSQESRSHPLVDLEHGHLSSKSFSGPVPTSSKSSKSCGS